MPRCCFARHGGKLSKIYNTRAQPVTSLNFITHLVKWSSWCENSLYITQNENHSYLIWMFSLGKYYDSGSFGPRASWCWFIYVDCACSRRRYKKSRRNHTGQHKSVFVSIPVFIYIILLLGLICACGLRPELELGHRFELGFGFG